MWNAHDLLTALADAGVSLHVREGDRLGWEADRSRSVPHELLAELPALKREIIAILVEADEQPVGVMSSRIAELEQRLIQGEQRIESETDPERRAQLEDFWISLLHSYEAAYDTEYARDGRERRTA